MPRTRRCALSAVAAIAAMLSLVAGPATAATVPVTTTLTGGGLTLTSYGFALGGYTLDGTTQTLAPVNSSTGWSVTDARGTTGSWTVTVSGTDLVSAAGDTAPFNTGKTLNNENMKINAPTVTPGVGADSTPPTGSAINALDTVPATLVASDGGGSKGSYTFTPAMVLTIPANTQPSNFTAGTSGAQNAHTATLTITLA